METDGEHVFEIHDKTGYIIVRIDSSTNPVKIDFSQSLCLQIVLTDSVVTNADLVTTVQTTDLSKVNQIFPNTDALLSDKPDSLTSLTPDCHFVGVPNAEAHQEALPDIQIQQGILQDFQVETTLLQQSEFQPAIEQDSKASLVGLVNFSETTGKKKESRSQSTQTEPRSFTVSTPSARRGGKREQKAPNSNNKGLICSRTVKNPGNFCLRCKLTFKTAAALRRHLQKPCQIRELAVVLRRLGDSSQGVTGEKEKLWNTVRMRNADLSKGRTSETQSDGDGNDNRNKGGKADRSLDVVLAIGAEENDEASKSDTEDPDYKDVNTSKSKSHAKFYTCDLCGESIRGIPQLRLHKKEVHQKEHRFPCPVCHQTFKFLHGLTKHKRENGHLIYKRRLERVCKFCGKQFRLVQELLAHKKVHGLFCEICKEQFKLQGLLQRHLREKHKDDVDSEGNKLVKSCPKCIRVYTSEEKLQFHLRTHETHKRHVCHKCGAMFSRKQTLGEHIRTHDPSFKVTPGFCELCGKQFGCAKSFKHHMIQVHCERRYKCPHCDKTFANCTRLNLHQLCHTKEKPHVCEVCHKGFSQSYNLTIHMRTHTKEKPFVCTVCGLSFGHRCSLQGHMRSIHKAAT